MARQLHEITSRRGDPFGWRERAAALRLDPDEVLRAVSEQPARIPDWRVVFAPYEGDWIGGDLHRTDRLYQHIWYPTVIDGALAAQPVLMMRAGAGGAWTLAYDFCEAPDRITGLVGERVHRGYALGGGPLLWVAAELDGSFSLHLERVWADGQLYDIRGILVGVEQGCPVLRGRSDWRYHRLPDGTVAASTDC